MWHVAVSKKVIPVPVPDLNKKLRQSAAMLIQTQNTTSAVRVVWAAWLALALPSLDLKKIADYVPNASPFSLATPSIRNTVAI